MDCFIYHMFLFTFYHSSNGAPCLAKEARPALAIANVYDFDAVGLRFGSSRHYALRYSSFFQFLLVGALRQIFIDLQRGRWRH